MQVDFQLAPARVYGIDTGGEAFFWAYWSGYGMRKTSLRFTTCNFQASNSARNSASFCGFGPHRVETIRAQTPVAAAPAQGALHLGPRTGENRSEINAVEVAAGLDVINQHAFAPVAEGTDGQIFEQVDLRRADVPTKRFAATLFVNPRILIASAGRGTEAPRWESNTGCWRLPVGRWFQHVILARKGSDHREG